MLWSDFQKPKKLDYDPETLTANYGRFVAQPFERGFGTTIGNALRRVLLSSIEGAAITALRVEGVLHEFSSLTGVVEDMTDVVLNLKQIPFKLHGDGPKTLYLEKKGPGVVTAADFDQDADIEILDPAAHIATLSKEGNLKLEARLKRGRGYVVADRNADSDLPLGYIPVDSIHSPVRRVNYHVEGARVGQMTDYDKLIIEVWTNGAVSPQEAVGLAADLLADHLRISVRSRPAAKRPRKRRSRKSIRACRRCWPSPSRSSTSPSARRTASRTPTSAHSVISCSAPSVRCCPPRTSAANRSTRSKTFSPASDSRSG